MHSSSEWDMGNADVRQISLKEWSVLSPFFSHREPSEVGWRGFVQSVYKRLKLTVACGPNPRSMPPGRVCETGTRLGSLLRLFD